MKEIFLSGERKLAELIRSYLLALPKFPGKYVAMIAALDDNNDLYMAAYDDTSNAILEELKAIKAIVSKKPEPGKIKESDN